MTKISFIVVAYNAAQSLDALLGDLLAQTVRPVGQHHLGNAEARNALRVPEVRTRAQRGLLLAVIFDISSV